jgi:hypothetical protein
MLSILHTNLTRNLQTSVSFMHHFSAWHPLYIETLHETYKVCCIPATLLACPPLYPQSLHQPYNQNEYLIRTLARAKNAPIYRQHVV